MAADTTQPENVESICAVIPIGRGRSSGGFTAADEARHDNPHWPVRSPDDAARALLLHDECPWHCSTRVAALLVSNDDYQYFRDRGLMGSDSWTTQSES